MSNIAFIASAGIVGFASGFAGAAAHYSGKRKAVDAQPLPLRVRVRLLILGGSCAGLGFAEPLTTPEQRLTLATSVLSVTNGTVRAIARWAGLRPLVAELPEGAPVAIVGDALLYRDGPDANALILSVACARIFESAGIPAVDSDSWLLADMLSPGDVFG